MVWGQGSPIAHVRRSGAPALPPMPEAPPIPMPPPPDEASPPQPPSPLSSNTTPTAHRPCCCLRIPSSLAIQAILQSRPRKTALSTTTPTQGLCASPPFVAMRNSSHTRETQADIRPQRRRGPMPTGSAEIRCQSRPQWTGSTTSVPSAHAQSSSPTSNPPFGRSRRRLSALRPTTNRTRTGGPSKSRRNIKPSRPMTGRGVC